MIPFLTDLAATAGCSFRPAMTGARPFRRVEPVIIRVQKVKRQHEVPTRASSPSGEDWGEGTGLARYPIEGGRSGRHGKRSIARERTPAKANSLFLLGPDHHDHLAPFEPGVRLDLAVVADVFLDLAGQVLAEILVRHLAAAEADGDLDLVAFFQEAKHVAQLDLVVAHIRDRTELHFLDLDLLLLLLGGRCLLLGFELELAVIHDAADRRVAVGLDLDQIHARFLRQCQRLVAGQDAQLFRVGADHAHARHADFEVTAIALVVGGSDTTILQKSYWIRPRRTSTPRFGLKSFDEVGQRHAAQILARTGTHGNGPRFLLTVTDHEKIRDLLQRMLADFIADFFVAQIGLDAEAFIDKGLRHLAY